MRGLTGAQSSDRGFTLIEMVVASGIILTVVSVFAIFMSSVSQIQTKLTQDQILSNVLSSEVEKVNALNWDDIVLADAQPTSTTAVCSYSDAGHMSSRAISPGPELVVYPDDFTKSSNTNSVTPLIGQNVASNRVLVQVYRNVTWYSDPTVQVKTTAPTNTVYPTCDYRPDLKSVTITVRLYTVKKAVVTEATGSSGKITYKAANNFEVGDVVSITGLSSAGMNVTGASIVSVTPTTFTVAGNATGTITNQNGTVNAVNGTPDTTKDSPFKTKSMTVFKSLFTQAVLGNTDSTAYSTLTELGNANVRDGSLWGGSYTENGTLVPSGCTALSYNDPVAQQIYLQGTYNASGSSVCGYGFTGFEVGKSYTAVAEVYVPTDSTTTELAVVGSGRSTPVLPSSTWQTLTYTWTANQASYKIGPAASTGATRPAGSLVRVRSLIVYVNG